MTDVLVVGAGPAGMAAALELTSRGLAVTVVDDQPAPGGRIFAAIEKRALHSAEDRSGADLVARFRKAGGTYLSSAEVWQIEPGPRAFLTQSGAASMIEPNFILLATGAQERPLPFPGWQLPGVMTVGGAQILLKTAKQLPDVPVWLAGTGPLLLLCATQLIEAGGAVAGILDTSLSGSLAGSLRHLPRAIGYGWRDLMRGALWLRRLRKLKIVRDIASIEALGSDRLQTIRYVSRSGSSGEIPARLLLVHGGVIPSVHNTIAAGCEHVWNDRQRCFEPMVDQYGASSNQSIFIAGDGATIAGARAAILSGRLSAIGIALAAGKLSRAEAEAASRGLRRKLRSAQGFRLFIDTLYEPTELPLPDRTIVCRCEEVTASDIRSCLSERPHIGPDGVKIATRAGMGPCQGRQCGLSLTRLAAEAAGSRPSEIGFLRIRPPLKSLTLGELATLETAS